MWDEMIWMIFHQLSHLLMEAVPKEEEEEAWGERLSVTVQHSVVMVQKELSSFLEPCQQAVCIRLTVCLSDPCFKYEHKHFTHWLMNFYENCYELHVINDPSPIISLCFNSLWSTIWTQWPHEVVRWEHKIVFWHFVWWWTI